MTQPVLHNYFRSSTSHRVRIAMALKGVSYEYKAFHLRKGEHRQSSYLSLNPQGLVPTLSWTDGSTFTQSLAIIEFLDEVIPHPPLLPVDPLPRQRVRSLAQMIAIDIHPINNLRVLTYLRNEFGVTDHDIARWFRHWVTETFESLERRLAAESQTGRYCHGDNVTLADVCLSAQLSSNQRFDIDVTPYPTIKRIASALDEIPAFRAAAPDNQPDRE